MKKITKHITLLLCSISLILSGCAETDGDFWGTEATISFKIQSLNDKEKKQARYHIKFNDNKYSTLILILPESFGEVGDIIIAENRTLKIVPVLKENNK